MAVQPCPALFTSSIVVTNPATSNSPAMDDLWYLTVVRTQGMRLMRPEKAWRPIITVEVDKHHLYETVMGVDGQNPNLKERVELRQVHNTSRIDVRVWHRSQSKKKAKRTLVALASHTLSELVRLQEREHRKEVELRLQCQSATKRAISSRGRPQNGATILLRIRPPPHAKHELESELVSANDDGEHWEASSEAGSSTRVSEHSSMPPSPTDDIWLGPDGGPTSVRRLRRRTGYHINSDDENCSLYSEDDDAASKPPIFSDGASEFEFGDDNDDIAHIPRSASGPREWIHAIWPSLLPQYTERIEVPQDMTFVERILASFTMYNELKHARAESQFESVFVRLQTEWTYVGGLLVALAAVNTAVFAIGPGAVFDVESYARSAIAASSIASGLGIACDAWFLLRYTWADLHTFITRALDIYSTYLFFSLSARVPALCLFISALALMAFMGLVAFEVWPAGVLVMCVGVGMVMGLQFVVFGVGWCVRGVERGMRGVGRGVRWVVGAGRVGAKGEGEKRMGMDG